LFEGGDFLAKLGDFGEEGLEIHGFLGGFWVGREEFLLKNDWKGGT
jgi:hypothetical protein